MPAQLTRLFIAFAVSVVVTYTLASVAHTQQVLAGLLKLGVLIPVADRIGMIAGDWVGLYLYLAVIAIGLLIAFGVMAQARRVLPVPGVMLYAMGGALAMLVILVSMRELASLTPIAGARGVFGTFLQCLAGAIGGAVFGISLDRLDGPGLLSRIRPVPGPAEWRAGCSPTRGVHQESAINHDGVGCRLSGFIRSGRHDRQ